MSRESLVVGIDIGTGSARAGVFTLDGRMLGSHTVPIKMGKPKPDFVEQSSEDIWAAACMAVKEACTGAKAKPEDVIGLSYDATCSLVALDASHNGFILTSLYTRERCRTFLRRVADGKTEHELLPEEAEALAQALGQKE